MGAALGARRFATIDPEEFYDFQATRPTIRFVDGISRARRLARGRGPRRHRPGRAARPGPAHRPRAVATAGARSARRSSTSPRRSASSSSSRSAPARPTSRTRARSRSPGLASDDALIERARPHAVELRGADGHRRRAARRVPEARHPVGVACGRPFRTTSPWRRTRRARSRSCASSRASSASPSTRRSWRPRPSSTSARSTAPSSPTPTCRRSSSGSSARRRPRRSSRTSDALPSGDVIAREFQRFLRQRGGGRGPRAARAVRRPLG